MTMPDGSIESGARAIIGYPTNRLLAVIDRPADGEAARAALLAAGFGPDAVTVITRPAGAPSRVLRSSRGGVRARLRRAVQFMTMDQTPDFLVYEAALADGRAVVAVAARDREEVLRARVVVRAYGAHFVNWFGQLATEEFELWRGPEPAIPGYLRR